MKKFLVTILFVSMFSLSANDNLFSRVSDGKMVELEEKGYLKNSGVKYQEGFVLIPDEFSFKAEFLTLIKEYDPELCVELLLIFDKPSLEGDELTKLLQENILAVSEQVGIEYFSHNRNKMYPLIKKSYHTIDNKKKNKIDDPVITNLKDIRKYTIFQEDTTFGGNFYSIKSRIKDGIIWNQMDNLNNLTVYYIFKALNKGALRVDYFIIPNKDKVIMYSVVQIQDPPQVTEVLGRKVNIPDSVRKRIQAVIEWFIERVKGK